MSRVATVWARIRASLWFLPALLTAAAVIFAFSTVQIDRSGVLAPRDMWFLFGAGAEGARGVLSTIAGSIITVTGVVFSITIVVLQLASSQFTPRVLQNFTQDRMNQLVLGVFIGTFTYSLLVLRSVRSAFEDNDRFVPSLSVTVALLLALVSIGFLIYFIDHIARSIQAEVVIDRAAKHALRIVDRMYPEELGDAGASDPRRAADPARLDNPVPIHAKKGGYIQAVDVERVIEIATENDLLVAIEQRIGNFVLPGDVLLRVWPGSTAHDRLHLIRNAVTIGPERTRYQDLERGLIELTDIGVRALSPSLNDPTTAMVSIDRVTEVLAILAWREFPPPEHSGQDARVRLILQISSFEDAVDVAFRPLIEHAAGHGTVCDHLAHALTRLHAMAPPSRRPSLAKHLKHVRG